MTTPTESVLQQALQLSEGERATLIDRLIDRLSPVEPTTEALWLREAEDRLLAYQAGQIEAIDANHVFSNFDDQL